MLEATMSAVPSLLADTTFSGVLNSILNWSLIFIGFSMVIFVHEFAGDHRSWEPQLRYFSRRYRCIAFNARGYPPSDVPGDLSMYSQARARDDIKAVLDRLEADDCESLIIVNLANADIVGHTGNLKAATRAVEVVDECVGQIVEGTLNRQGSLVVTADHGNAEQMFNPQQDCPHTAHTTYDVFLSVIGDAFKGRRLRPGGRLADIAPTVLDLMGLAAPAVMTGQSLLGPRRDDPA